MLVMALCLSMASPAAFAAGTPSTWAQAEVDAARTANLVIGDADGNFQGNITRELFCRLIVNMVEKTMGAPVAVTISNPFGDTSDTDIIKAYQMGVVNGVSATEFAPDAYITREQVAVMMMRAARKLDDLSGSAYEASADVSGLSFADEGEISFWALEDIKIANALGIMNGVGQGRIDPQGTTTVEQSILLTFRLHNEFKAFNGGTVVPVNHGPEAKSDPVAFTLQEQTAVIYNAGQLADDSDGDDLEITQINGVAASRTLSHGDITLMSDGRIRYESEDLEADATENFTVTVSDGSETAIVRVRLNVEADLDGNHAPVPKADPYEAVPFLELQTYDNLRAMDVADDPDGDDLEVVAVNGQTGTVATTLGTAVIQSDGTASYTSRNVDVESIEIIEITVSDGTDTAVVRLRLTIVPLSDGTPAPIASDIEFTVEEGHLLAVPVEDIAEDPDGDELIVTHVEGAQWGATLISNSGRTAGGFNYLSSDLTLNRTETLTVTVSDGDTPVDVKVTVKVLEVGNLPPQKIGSGTMTFPVNEQTPLQIQPGQIAQDPDGDFLYITKIVRTSSAYGEASIFPLFMYNRMDFTSYDITENKLAKYTLTVSDGTDTIDVPIQIPIYRVNQAPEPIGGAVPVVHATSGTKGATFYIYATDIAVDPDGDPLSIEGIYRLDYSNTSYDIPGERLDLSPHYGYVYYDEANDRVMNTPGRDLTGFIEDFFIRVTDGIASTDIRVSVDFE